MEYQSEENKSKLREQLETKWTFTGSKMQDWTHENSEVSFGEVVE